MTRSQLVFGVLFVALGALLLAEQAGLIVASSVIAEWWPTVVIAAGLAQWLTRPRNLLGGALLTAIGGVLLLWAQGWVTTVSLIWPILLIGLGTWLLGGHAGRAVTRIEREVDLSAVFDDRTVARTGLLEGGSVVAVFGDVSMDLSDATIADGGTTLQTTTIFGDIDLDVPDHWRITVSGPELFGAVSLRPDQQASPDAPVLHLRVLTIFGDIDIRRSRSSATDVPLVSGGGEHLQPGASVSP